VEWYRASCPLATLVVSGGMLDAGNRTGPTPETVPWTTTDVLPVTCSVAVGSVVGEGLNVVQAAKVGPVFANVWEMEGNSDSTWVVPGLDVCDTITGDGRKPTLADGRVEPNGLNVCWLKDVPWLYRGKKNMLMPSLTNTLLRNRSFSNWYPGDQETFYLRLQTFTMMCAGIWCFWAIAQNKMIKIHWHFRTSCHFQYVGFRTQKHQIIKFSFYYTWVFQVSFRLMGCSSHIKLTNSPLCLVWIQPTMCLQFCYMLLLYTKDNDTWFTNNDSCGSFMNSFLCISDMQ